MQKQIHYFKGIQTIESEGLIGNALKQGGWKFYHQNGKLKKVRSCQDGLAAGECFGYHENGKNW